MTVGSISFNSGTHHDRDVASYEVVDIELAVFIIPTRTSCSCNCSTQPEAENSNDGMKHKDEKMVQAAEKSYQNDISTLAESSPNLTERRLPH